MFFLSKLHNIRIVDWYYDFGLEDDEDIIVCSQLQE